MVAPLPLLLQQIGTHISFAALIRLHKLGSERSRLPGASPKLPNR
jgi:hypothetical protein